MRYQYTSDGFKKDFYSQNKKFTLNAVTSLILINLFIYFISTQAADNKFFINETFGLNSNNFQIWQLGDRGRP